MFINTTGRHSQTSPRGPKAAGKNLKGRHQNQGRHADGMRNSAGLLEQEGQTDNTVLRQKGREAS